MDTFIIDKEEVLQVFDDDDRALVDDEKVF